MGVPVVVVVDLHVTNPGKTERPMIGVMLPVKCPLPVPIASEVNEVTEAASEAIEETEETEKSKAVDTTQDSIQGSAHLAPALLPVPLEEAAEARSAEEMDRLLSLGNHATEMVPPLMVATETALHLSPATETVVPLLSPATETAVPLLSAVTEMVLHLSAVIETALRPLDVIEMVLPLSVATEKMVLP